jgi:hypothetical protein
MLSKVSKGPEEERNDHTKCKFGSIRAFPSAVKQEAERHRAMGRRRLLRGLTGFAFSAKRKTLLVVFSKSSQHPFPSSTLDMPFSLFFCFSVIFAAVFKP